MTLPGPTPAPPAFVAGLFGYRVNRQGVVTNTPNFADSDNQPSIQMARAVMNACGVPPGTTVTGDPGLLLEQGMEAWIGAELPVLAPPPGRWSIVRKRLVTDFVQYEHLARLQAIIDADTTKTLKSEIGTDYVIKPDVTVGLAIAVGNTLHAAISCKWTIRSDRVQNIRHEAVILTRHRRGRQPHIVVVTAEPLPSRIAAIARGTGEVDAVYHVALDPLANAVATHGSTLQQDVFGELVGQGRLKNLTVLPSVLAD